jgi:hypothetical protein
MNSNPMSFKKKITSQWGEDGIIEEIFNRIGLKNKYCVEFGAWDGIHLSNSWNLWSNQGWSAILIEGDSDKFLELKQNTAIFKNVKPINAFVSPKGENSLDNILEKVDIPADFDLLSIDIDSDDYYIFESLNYFNPRVVIVEYNPTIPPDLDIVQDQGECFGSSALALVNLAHKKNYSLVGCTQSNLVFVLNEEYCKLGISEPKLSDIFPRDHLTYVITSQEGLNFLTRQPTYCADLAKKNFFSMLFSNRKKAYPKLKGYPAIPVEIFKNN